MSIQISVGEWEMKNGRKAVVLGRVPNSDTIYPWIGYRYVAEGNTLVAIWRDNGDCADTHTNERLVAPWTSPIAPGHNPDRYTVEQVGDGWWLPEWEILEKVTERQRLKYLEFGSSHIQKWLHTQGAGKCAVDCTYRTRLTRDELLALITPKKRLIWVEELPAVCHIGNEGKGSWLVTSRLIEEQVIHAQNNLSFKIEVLHKMGRQYSSDLKTWHSFEVEDTK